AKRVVRLNAPGCPDIDATIREVGQTPLPPYIERQPDQKDISRYQTVFAREEGAVAAPTAGLHFTPELLQKIADNGIETAEVTLHVGAGTFMPVKAERIEDHVMHPEWYRVSPETASAINRVRERGGRVITVGSTSTRTLETVTDANGVIHAAEGWSDLFITPGYRFKSAAAMITNFHLPKSTLLMMVAAFAGLDFMLAAYDEAIAEKYRFYSYGDAMLIL
ncbi:MAG: tRNA preQ1(34) S-adenosylmethionine ribosyltransferase-isomerase QueA, partial [Nitrospirota bacterium]|nr:tRNA preQ1(34) S-adenosylmethionine ribosyltransferase-isomerase QueA [Nitrospirota bacterium]